MIKSLNTFRFITALAIFSYHCYFSYCDINVENLVSSFARGLAIFMTGFFILSGFILSYVYDQTNFLDKENIRFYFIKRFSRIYPVYFLVSLIYFIFSSGISNEKLFQAFINDIFLIQGFFQESLKIGINKTTWSVSAEMFLYLVFPCIVIFNKNYKFLVIFSLIFSIIISINFIIDYDYYIYSNPIIRIADFVFGIGIYHARHFFKKLKYRNLLHFSIILLAIFLSLIVNSKHMAFQYVVIPVFGIWIVCCYYSKSFIYNNKITSYLGLISYSFYLWQFISIGLGRIILKFHPNFSFFKLYFLTFTINILISIYSYHFIELKARNYINNKLNKKIAI